MMTTVRRLLTRDNERRTREPALRFSRIDLNETLKESGRSSTSGPGGRRIQNTLVVSEIALSLVLLVGAGLLIRSFLALKRVDPGFSAQNVLSFRLALEGAAYASADSRLALFGRLWERLEKLPGVESVGGSLVLPLTSLSLVACRLLDSCTASVKGGSDGGA